MADTARSLDITIRTKAELDGAQRAIESLEKAIGQAKASGKPIEQLEAQLAKARKAVADFNAANPNTPDGPGGFFGAMREQITRLVPALGPVLDFFGKLGGGLLGGIAATGTAVVSVFAAMRRGIAEYAGAEREIAKLDAALAQHGLLTDANRAKWQELATEMERATSIADDEWIVALRTLTQFGADDTNISGLADAVKNLAGIMGGDLSSASTLVARALQGNFDQFSRYGIVIDRTGTKQEQLKSLMQQLARAGGGQLEAQAKTLSGQWANLHNQFSNFFEAIGGWMAQTGLLQLTIGTLANIAEWWAEKLGGVIPKIDGLTNASKSNAPAMEDASLAQARYNDAIQDTVNKAKAAADSIEREKAAMEAKKRLQDEEADAKMAYELAQVDLAEQSGQANPQQAIAARFRIRQRYAEEAFAREQQLRREQIEADKAIIENYDRQQEQLQELIRLQTERLELVQNYERADADVQRGENEIEATRAEIARLIATRGTMIGSAGSEARVALEEDIAVAQNRLAMLERLKPIWEGRLAKTKHGLPPGAKSSAEEAALLNTYTGQAAAQAAEAGQQVPGLRDRVISTEGELASAERVRSYQRGTELALATHQATAKADQPGRPIRDIQSDAAAAFERIAIEARGASQAPLTPRLQAPQNRVPTLPPAPLPQAQVVAQPPAPPPQAQTVAQPPASVRSPTAIPDASAANQGQLIAASRQMAATAEKNNSTLMAYGSSLIELMSRQNAALASIQRQIEALKSQVPNLRNP